MTDTAKTTSKSSKVSPAPGAEMSESIDTPTLESIDEPTSEPVVTPLAEDDVLYALTSTVLGVTNVLGIFNRKALIDRHPNLTAIDSGEFIDRDESGNGLTAYPCRPHIL